MLFLLFFVAFNQERELVEAFFVIVKLCTIF